MYPEARLGGAKKMISSVRPSSLNRSWLSNLRPRYKKKSDVHAIRIIDPAVIYLSLCIMKMQFKKVAAMNRAKLMCKSG